MAGERLKVLLALMLLPGVCRAEPTLTPVPAGPDIQLPLLKGDPAPLTGVLFDPATALRWANYLQQCKLRLTTDVELEKKKGEAETERVRGTFQLRLDLSQQAYLAQALRVQELEKRLTQPPLTQTVWFGMGVGILGTVGVGALGAYLLRR